MTTKRDKEIEAAALSIFKEVVPHLKEDEYFEDPSKSITQQACIKMAKWADAHPSPEVLALVEALAKISLGHQYGCGTNDGLRCTCVASIANDALANFNKARGG